MYVLQLLRKMMKMKYTILMGLLVILCVSLTAAEESKAEPEPESEAEPKADEDGKHGSAGKQIKGV